MTELNVSRRVDRRVMAKAVAGLAKEPWTATLIAREDGPDAHPIFDKRRTDVTLKGPRGLTVTVDFRGDSKLQREGTFVLSWHGVEDGAKLNPDQFQSVNQFHWHKATDVAEGFPMLLKVLELRMAAAVNGSAFQ